MTFLKSLSHLSLKIQFQQTLHLLPDFQDRLQGCFWDYKSTPSLINSICWNRKMQHKASSQPFFLKLSYFNALHMVHFVSLITSLLPISAIVAIPPPKHTFKPEHSGRHKEVLNTPSEICDAAHCINVGYFLYETKRNGSENKRNKHKLGSTEGQGEGLLHSGHPATSSSGLKSHRGKPGYLMFPRVPLWDCLSKVSKYLQCC